MTLAEFLLARIAEDEVVAREVPGPPDEKGLSWWGEYGHLSVSPARVLAECAVKRQIVQDWLDAESLAVETVRFSQATAVIYSAIQGGMEAPVRRLAALYADHPDYRQEWRP